MKVKYFLEKLVKREIVRNANKPIPKEAGYVRIHKSLHHVK